MIKKDAWYGWPDFAAGEPVTKPQFQSERGPAPKFLMKNHPEVPKPVARLGLHCGAAKLALSRNAKEFGHEGHLFLALFGDLKPMTGTDTERAGHKVVHIDPRTGQVHDFFQARTKGKLPVEVFQTKGPRRPIDVRFSPTGDALYVVDFGSLAVIETASGPESHPIPGTGSIWRISRKGVKPRPLGGTPRSLND